MRKTLIIGAAIALLIPMVSLAATFRAGEQVTVQTGETIIGDIYIAGGAVTSAGMVEGDLVAGGGNVIVSGKVSGDLMAGGGTVSVLADVADDVRISGGTVTVSALVGGDLIIGGGQVNVSGAGVSGDLIVGGGTVSISAPITGKVKIAGGNVYLNSSVTGELNIQADKLTLGPSAIISGNLNYKAREVFTKEEGAQVLGVVNFVPRSTAKHEWAGAAAFLSFIILAKFIALLVSALILGYFFRRYCNEVSKKATERPMLELGRGVLVAIVLPVLSALLLVTVIATPFGILGLLATLALTIFSWILTPIVIGSVVWRYFNKQELAISWKSTLLGVLIFQLITIIPILGGLFCTLAMLTTLGAISEMKWHMMREWR